MRHYDPILELGQDTRRTHAFTLVDVTQEGNPAIDLTNATEVRLSVEHKNWGETVIDGTSVTVPDAYADEGYVEYTFTPDETRLYGAHYLQFEVEWSDGSTGLVPPDGYDWTLYIGRRLPKDSPLRADRAIFDSGSVGDLEVETFTVGTGGPYASLEGPGLYNDEGELAVSVDAEGVDGLTNPLTEHMDANSYDILDPRDIGKDATRARNVFTQGLTASSATVESPPTASGEVARYDETSALESDVAGKADATGDGTTELTGYGLVESATVQSEEQQIGSDPAEVFSATDSTLSFTATADHDLHDVTALTLSNPQTAEITEEVTVDYYRGVDATGTLVASDTQSVTIAAETTTTTPREFLADDFSLAETDYYIEASSTNLTVDSIEEYTLGAAYRTTQEVGGDLVTTDQAGRERRRFDATSDTVTFPAVETDAVTAQSVETVAARIRAATPGVRLSGTETDAADLSIRENAGAIELYDEATGAVAGSWDLNPTLENASIAALDESIAELRADTAANQPAAGTANRIFIATDTGTIERDTGTTWDIVGTASISDTDHTASDHESGGGLEITHNNLTLNSDDHHGRPIPGTLLTEDESNTFHVDHTAADHEAGGSLAITLGNIASMDPPAILVDTAANRPAAGTADRVFVETDTGTVYRDNGTAWDVMGTTNITDTDHTAADHEAGGSLEVAHNNLTTESDDHHVRPVAGTLLSEDADNNFNVDIAVDSDVTASGDSTGGTTTFTLPHSLGAVPTVAHVQETSADAAGFFYVSNKTSTDIDITYDAAPPDGTDNLTFDIITA